jgi:hypothetical protein
MPVPRGSDIEGAAHISAIKHNARVGGRTLIEYEGDEAEARDEKPPNSAGCGGGSGRQIDRPREAPLAVQSWHGCCPTFVPLIARVNQPKSGIDRPRVLLNQPQ